MIARSIFGMAALLVACTSGEPQPTDEAKPANTEQQIIEQYLGIWRQTVPSGDVLPNQLTCRINANGGFRLIFQHGHLRPFADHRGNWTLREDGQLGVRFHSEGADPDTITVRADGGRIIVPFPLYERQELIFGRREGAPPST